MRKKISFFKHMLKKLKHIYVLFIKHNPLVVAANLLTKYMF